MVYPPDNGCDRGFDDPAEAIEPCGKCDDYPCHCEPAPAPLVPDELGLYWLHDTPGKQVTDGGGLSEEESPF